MSEIREKYPEWSKANNTLYEIYKEGTMQPIGWMQMLQMAITSLSEEELKRWNEHYIPKYREVCGDKK